MKNKEELLDYIDDKYMSAKLRKVSRFSVEWGAWSREMNLGLRKRIESKKDPEELALKYIIIYWTIRSQMLELFYKRKFFGKVKKERLAKEAADIKELILTGDLKDISWEQAAKSVLKGG